MREGKVGRSVKRSKGETVSEKSIGVSVDGDVVTVVETLGDLAVSATTVAAGSLRESLETALSGVKSRRGSRPLRVALLAPSTLLRRMDATAAHAASRSEFENAVFNALPANRDTSLPAGAFLDVDAMVADRVAPGVAVVTPASLVQEVYAALGSRPAEVVASPLTLAGFDGVWLGVHYSVADVALVSDGRIAAYRQLRAGGLSALISVLGDPASPELGRSRLLGAITGTAPEDTLADVELARYMRMVVAEFSQTLEFWRRSGEVLPSSNTVLLYGPGGTAPAAFGALDEAGLVGDVPDLLMQALSYIPPASRPESLAAFCAAVTAGRHMPQASFVNPHLAEIAAKSRRNRKRAFAGAVSLAGLAAGGLLVAKPIYEGWSASKEAERELNLTNIEFAEKSTLYYQAIDLQARADVIDIARASEPNWSGAYELIYFSLPSSAQLDQITTSVDGDALAVSISVSLTGDGYSEMTQWLSRLKTTPGVLEAWSTGFSQREGLTSVVLSLRLALDVESSDATSIADAVSEIAPNSDGTEAGTTTVPDGSTSPDQVPPTVTDPPTTPIDGEDVQQETSGGSGR
jgi:hypothetical protein